MQRKGALPGKIFARCILQRRFAGHFGCMARISCQSQPFFGCMARESCRELAIFPPEAAFGMHGAQNLPRIDARERTAAESCHGKALENAPRENIATASQAKGASGLNPATVGRWGTHFESILPSSSARERTVVKSCHYQSPENAFRAYPAIAGRLGMHSVDILPSPDIREAIARYPRTHSVGIPPLPVARHAALSTWGSEFSPLAVLWGFGAQHFPCEGVDIPPSRGLTAGNDFESALFRWATMSPLRVLQSCAVLCAEAKSALTFI